MMSGYLVGCSGTYAEYYTLNDSCNSFSNSTSYADPSYSEDSDVEEQPKTWNDMFQSILAMENSYTKFKRLSNLAKDFTFSAKIYGNIIISELFLPNKRIPQMKDMGRAGGDKYICAGITFNLSSSQSWQFVVVVLI
jgi:hypothetical protein